MIQKEFSFFGLADINSNRHGSRDERDALVMRLQGGSSKILSTTFSITGELTKKRRQSR